MLLGAPLRSVVVIGLLLLGTIFVYFPNWQLALWGQPAPNAASHYTYWADLDFWQRTDRERKIAATAHFDLDHDLRDVPLQVGDWQGVEAPETNQEVMILLDPEQYVQRLYQNTAGQYIWLSMIGGRSSQPFHAPDICYDADGWQYDLGSHAVPLSGGGDLYGLWLEAKKEIPASGQLAEHVVFYFYLFPTAERWLSDGIVLFKLTSGRYGTLEETLTLQTDFIQKFFTAAESHS